MTALPVYIVGAVVLLAALVVGLTIDNHWKAKTLAMLATSEDRCDTCGRLYDCCGNCRCDPAYVCSVCDEPLQHSGLLWAATGQPAHYSTTCGTTGQPHRAIRSV